MKENDHQAGTREAATDTPTQRRRRAVLVVLRRTHAPYGRPSLWFEPAAESGNRKLAALVKSGGTNLQALLLPLVLS